MSLWPPFSADWWVGRFGGCGDGDGDGGAFMF